MFDPRRATPETVEEFIKITTLLSTERDLNRLLNMILTSARKLTGCEAGRVYILDNTKRHLHLEVCQNDRVEAHMHGLPPVELFRNNQRNDANVRAYCAFSGSLVKVDDVYRYSGFDFSDLYEYDRLYGYRTQSVITVPLRDHSNTTIGVLELINPLDPRSRVAVPFPEALEGIVAAFASQAAVALNNVQLIEKNRRLIEILDHTNATLEQENKVLRDRIEGQYRFSNIVGEAPTMRRVFELMGKVVNTDATVLVRGETGTGKELIARAIHYNSRRKGFEFVTQNCAALPEGLLESELFGYRKGAFSGANTDKKGLIELADGGTLFLDEIGDMPVGLQAKMLRVLQENEVRPLGSVETRKVNVRVVAATHCDLQEKIRSGDFREDLYYRLCVFPIELPPLRDRREDLPSLLQYFLQECSERYHKTLKGLSPAAMDCLLQHDYPGNIRELRNIMERAVLLCDEDSSIMPEHLPEELVARRGPGGVPAGMDVIGLDGDLRDVVGRFEASVIERKLQAMNWNQTRAARELNISRRTLIEKMHKYQIRRSGGHDFGRDPR